MFCTNDTIDLILNKEQGVYLKVDIFCTKGTDKIQAKKISSKFQL